LPNCPSSSLEVTLGMMEVETMANGSVPRAMEILLIEDSWSDIGLTIIALDAANVDHHTQVIRFGDEALSYLRREREYCCAPRPDLILLDLGLPRKDGRELLVDIKTDDHLCSIPLVVMTESTTIHDVMRGKEMAIDGYLTKPVEWPKFLEVVRALRHHWTEELELPLGT